MPNINEIPEMEDPEKYHVIHNKTLSDNNLFIFKIDIKLKKHLF